MSLFRLWKHWRICLTVYFQTTPESHHTTPPSSASPLQGFLHLQCLCQWSQWRNPLCQTKTHSLSSNLLLYLAQVSSLGRLYNIPQKVPLVSVGALCGLLMKFYLLCIFSTKGPSWSRDASVKLLTQLALNLFQLWQVNNSMVSSLGNPAHLTLENTKETATGAGVRDHRVLAGGCTGRDGMLWCAQDSERHWCVQDPPHLGSLSGANH